MAALLGWLPSLSVTWITADTALIDYFVTCIYLVSE